MRRTKLSIAAIAGLVLALPTASLAGGDPYGVTDPLPSVDAPPVADDPGNQNRDDLDDPSSRLAAGDLAGDDLASCGGDGAVARVVALSGAVHAQAPGGDPRALSCNDQVNACDTIITSPGARVGLMSQDVLAHVDTDTRLQIGTQNDAPDLFVRSGALRVIDTRASDASNYRVNTPHVSAAGTQGDTEVFVGIQQALARTRVCNHDRDVQLTGASGQVLNAAAGSCAVAAAGAALQSAPGSAPSIDTTSASPCALELASLVGLLGPDVAQGPPFGLPGFPGVGAPNNFQRGQCDNPGSGCGGSVTPTPPPTVTPPPSPPRRPPSRNIAIDPVPIAPCGAPGFGCGGAND